MYDVGVSLLGVANLALLVKFASYTPCMIMFESLAVVSGTTFETAGTY